MGKIVSSSIRTIIIIYFTYNLYYDIFEIELKYREKDSLLIPSFFQITVWNVITLIIYNAIAVLNDIIGTTESAPKDPPFIRKAKDYCFAVYAFPLSLYVSSTFWLCHFIKKDMFFQKRIEDRIPDWLNHSMHTLTSILVIIEMFVVFRKYPNSWKSAYLGLAIFAVCYASWIIFGKLYTGAWVYPIIEEFTIPMLILGPFVVYIYESFFYLFGRFINNKFWASELRKYEGRNIVSRKGIEI